MGGRFDYPNRYTDEQLAIYLNMNFNAGNYKE